MIWRTLFHPRARQKREALAAFEAALDARLAARKQARPKRTAAAKAGQSTRVRVARERDALCGEGVGR